MVRFGSYEISDIIFFPGFFIVKFGILLNLFDFGHHLE